MGRSQEFQGANASQSFYPLDLIARVVILSFDRMLHTSFEAKSKTFITSDVDYTMHAMQGIFLVMFWYFVRDPAEYRAEVVHSCLHIYTGLFLTF